MLDYLCIFNHHANRTLTGGMYFVAGKTWLIKKITGVLRENGRRVYVTASTGIAAANLKDVQATTINKLTGNPY